MNKWYLYILKCTDGTLYTGITTDVERRFEEHKAGKVGAKYTKAHKPEKIVYTEICASRSEAQVREAQIKKMTRIEKEALINIIK